MENCEIGGCIDKGKVNCPKCTHWSPSRGSKYYFCAQFEATKATCDLPSGSCETCDYYEGEVLKGLGAGRPNILGINWTDPDDVRKYSRKQKAARRAQLKREEENGEGFKV